MPVNPGRYGYQQNYPDITGDADKLMKSLLVIQERKNQRARQEELDALNRQIEEQRMAESAAQEVRAAEEAERARQEHELLMEKKKQDADLAKAAIQERKFQTDMALAEQRAKEAGVKGTEKSVPVKVRPPQAESMAPLDAPPAGEELMGVLAGARAAAEAAAPTEAPLSGLVRMPSREDYAVEGMPLPRTRDEWLNELVQQSLAKSAGSISSAQIRASRPGAMDPIQKELLLKQHGLGRYWNAPDNENFVWVWDNDTGKQDYISENQLRSAPQGKYSKKESKGGPIDKSKLEMAITALGGPDSDRADSLWNLATRINTDSSMLGAIKGPMTGTLSHLTKGRIAPDIRLYEGQIRGFASAIAKAMGESGRLSDQDIERTVMMFPVVGDEPDVTTRRLQSIWAVMTTDPASLVSYIKGEGVLPQGIAETMVGGGTDEEPPDA